MENIKKKYKDYLYKYLGAELFADKKLNMDELSESVFLILWDFYKQAINEFETAHDIEELDDIFYKYKKVMNETMDSYITTYCDVNRIDYEKLKYNIYFINNKKEIKIEDGFTYTYNILNKIAKRKDFALTFVQNVKDVVQDVKDTIKFK